MRRSHHNPMAQVPRQTPRRLLTFLSLGCSVGLYCGYGPDGREPGRADTTSRLQGLNQTLADCSTPANAVSELVNAIKAANAAGAGPHNITLAMGCTYTLTAQDNFWYGPNGLPPITSDITISGQGKSIIERGSVAATPHFRLFYVNGAPTTTAGGLDGLGALTLQNLTLRNGIAKGGDTTGDAGGGMGAGGAIFAQGNVTLRGVTLTGNTALGGSCEYLGNDGSGGGMGGDGGPGGTGGGGMKSSGMATGDGGSGPMGTEGGKVAGAGGTAAGSENGTNGPGGLGGGNRGLGVANASDGGSGFSIFGGNGGGGGAGFGGNGGNGVAGSVAGGGAFGGGGGGGIFGAGTAGGAGGVGGGGGLFAGGGFGGGGGAGATGGFGGGAGTQSTSLFGGGSGAPCNGGAGLGGAVFLMYGSFSATNSTLSGNTAQGGDSKSGGGGGEGLGGAVFNLNGAVTMNNATVAGNTVTGGTGAVTARASGGALYNLALAKNVMGTGNPSATVVLQNSILADSSAGKDLSNDQKAGTATVTATTANIVETREDIGGATTMATGILAQDPALMALADNGGPTLTRALMAGSPALGNGLVSICGDTATVNSVDQRNQPRSTTTCCVLGAFDDGSDKCANGHGCGAAATCRSSSCADSVCCDTACGGSNDSDCQVCSTAKGAAVNGTCGAAPAAANIVCRPTAGPCDTAEKCDGASMACPANTFKPNTTVCRAAAGVCDVQEMCPGDGAACPPDGRKAAGAMCKAAGSNATCDPADFCDGFRTSCPATFAPYGTTGAMCSAPLQCNGTGRCG